MVTNRDGACIQERPRAQAIYGEAHAIYGIITRLKYAPCAGIADTSGGYCASMAELCVDAHTIKSFFVT